MTRNFAVRVNAAIDGEPAMANSASLHSRPARWGRTFGGAAVAAGVAVAAVVALQQRAIAPTLHGVAAVTAQNIGAVHPKEALSYTVPAALPVAPGVVPQARLTNYVFAHSKYSSGLGQSNVLSGLLADADEQSGEPANGAAVKDAAVKSSAQHPLSQDAPIAP